MKKVKECPSCAMKVASDSKTCPICGYEFPQSFRVVQWIAVFLILVFLFMLLW